MRSFYLAWPGKAFANDPSGTPLSGQILSTVSRESTDAGIVSTASGVSTGLLRLAQAYPMPWSAYVCRISCDWTHLISSEWDHPISSQWDHRPEPLFDPERRV